MRAGTEIDGARMDQCCFAAALLQGVNAVFAFLKDWKMAQIISLTEGMMSL